jgi:hypothetical protein
MVRPVAENAAATWAAASAMAGLETPAEVWWAGDVPPTSGPAAPVGVTRVDLPVALPAPANAGITAFSVSRVPLVHARFQAYVQVALNAGADGPRTAVLEPRVAGLPLARRELKLEPGKTEGLSLEIEALQDQVLEVSLQMDGDVLAADDTVVARLPAARPLVVAWFTPSPDPFTTLALQALASEGEIEVFTGGPSQWPPPKLPDVAIFDGWLPDPWPAEVSAVVINPPGSSGPVRARPLDPAVPREEVRAVAEEHPVLFRLNPGRLALMQTSVLDASGVFQPLWMAGDQPVLVAGENGQQRLVVLACAPALSKQLPLTTSYPLLLGNAVYWCAERSGATRTLEVQASGTLVEGISAPIEWREIRNGALADSLAVPVPSTGMVVLDRLGLWRTADGAREGAVALLSRQETDLNAQRRPMDGMDAMDAMDASGSGGAGAPPRMAFGGEMTRWLIGLVLAALLLESWLYHRHALN